MNERTPCVHAESLAAMQQRLGPPPIDVCEVWCEQIAAFHADHPLFQSDPTSESTWSALSVDGNGRLIVSETTAALTSIAPSSAKSSPDVWVRRFHDAVTGQSAPLVETSLQVTTEEAKGECNLAKMDPLSETQPGSEADTIDPIGPTPIAFSPSGSGASQSRDWRRPLAIGTLVAAVAGAVVFFALPTDSPVSTSSPSFGVDAATSGSTLRETAIELPMRPSTAPPSDVAIVPETVGDLVLDSTDVTSAGSALDASTGDLAASLPKIQDVLSMGPADLFAASKTDAAAMDSGLGMVPDPAASLGLPASMSQEDEWDNAAEPPVTSESAEANKDFASVPGEKTVAVVLSGKDVRDEFAVSGGRLPAKLKVTASLNTDEELTAVWIDGIESENAKRARGLLVVHESGEDPADIATPVIAIAVDVRSGRAIKVRLRTAVRTGADVMWQNVDMSTLQSYAQSIANQGVQMDQAIAQLSGGNSNLTSRQRAMTRLQVDQIKSAAKQLAGTSRRVADLIALAEKFAGKNELKLSFAAN